MKKRAVEAAGILILLIVIFAVINTVSGGISDSMIKIDGEYYHKGTNELSLTLMTMDGTENLAEFPRLDSVKIIPYTEAVILASKTEDEAELAVLRKTVMDTYPDCTDVPDISFLSGTSADRIDISRCAVSDISPLAEAPKLRQLNISHTKVCDLSPLSQMGGVAELIMLDIPAEDYSPLLEMKSLTLLTVSASAEGEVLDALRDRGVTVTIPEE
ncbi:MAG: hypothetical protein ACI4Q6_08260 [Huintestinicola sp.]